MTRGVAPQPGRTDSAVLVAWLRASFVLRDTWETPNAELQRWEPADRDDQLGLLLRTCTDWTDDNAAIAFEMLDACARSAAGEPFAQTARWWGTEPGFLCTNWIVGQGLEEWSRERFRSGSPMPGDAVLGMYERVGLALRRYHEATTALASGRSSPGRGLSSRIRGAIGGKRFRTAGQVASIDDPGAHNVLVDVQGRPWLIDLPAHVDEVCAEQDIARLVRRLAGSYLRSAGDRGGPRKKHYEPVLAAVMSGYETGAVEETRPVDPVLVTACLATDAWVNTLRSFSRNITGSRVRALVDEGAAALRLTTVALYGRARMRPIPSQTSPR